MRQSLASRTGFTLIELITVMVAATVLLASLASTVLLSTQLMETAPQDDQEWRDREIADRLSADLRYASAVNEVSAYGFNITKPNTTTGTSETAVYESYYDGLTRRIDSGPVINLDEGAPGRQFAVDGYTAPTYLISGNVPRIRSSNTAATSGISNTLQIDLPSGCRDGDLMILAVTSRTPWAFYTPWDWAHVDHLYPGSLRLRVMYKTYSSSSPGPVSVGSFPATAMTAAIVAIENADLSSPIAWHDSSTGYASAFNGSTHPTALEPTNVYPNQLNVQILAAVGDPWYDGGLGLSGFTDALQRTAADGLESYINSVTMAVRTGQMPDLTTTPRVLHLSSGTWAQVGLIVGAAP